MVASNKKSENTLDEYTLNARLKPALLAAFPIGLAFTTLGLKASVITGILSGPLSLVGFTFLLAQAGRDLGKTNEPKLFAMWGGKPSTVKLRHRDASLNVHTRDRYHRHGETILGLKFPKSSDEASDPEGADRIYEAMGDSLRTSTRDKKKYPLVFNELLSYGFRRNLWGLKPVGLFISVAALLWQLLSIMQTLRAREVIEPATLASLILSALMLLAWIFVITPRWVKVAADSYAERLLESSEHAVPRSAEARPSVKRTRDQRTAAW